jgi:hypothetical protein
MKGLYQNLGIEVNPSTTCHPQTDGQTERVNQELEEYLRIYVNERQNDWVDWLPIAQFCHNDRSHSATGFSPFMITTGRHPFKGIYTGKETMNQTAEKYIERFKETWKTVTPCHKPFAQNTCFAHVSPLVTPHVDKDTLHPTSCRTHVLYYLSSLACSR